MGISVFWIARYITNPADDSVRKNKIADFYFIAQYYGSNRAS